MKLNTVILLFALALIGCSRADYIGTVSDVKHFAYGGAAIDMDGKYPNQKMTLYVSAADEAAVGPLPPVGATVTASGETVDYKGKPEIKIHSKTQWKW